MALPRGFDPRNMSFTAFRQAASNSRNPSGQDDQEDSFRPLSGLRHTRSRRSGLWARYDDFISDIGHWFRDNGETLSFYLTLALLATIAISFVVYVVRTWLAGHPFAAIITAGVGGAVAFHGFWIILAIPFLCFQMLFFACRVLFKNAAWFTMEVVAALGLYYFLTHEDVVLEILRYFGQ